MAATYILTVRNLCKTFAGKIILKKIDANFAPGNLTLIRGANGSGKSTFLKIVAGLLKQDSGEIVFSHSGLPAYMGHETFVYDQLDAYENLAFWRRVGNFPASDADMKTALKNCGLGKCKGLPVRHFSRGMLQRLHLARILIQNSPLLLLDEPSTGLDMAGKNYLRNQLKEMRKNGACIIMISHDPDYDYDLADFVLEIRNHALTPLPATCYPHNVPFSV